MLLSCPAMFTLNCSCVEVDIVTFRRLTDVVVQYLFVVGGMSSDFDYE